MPKIRDVMVKVNKFETKKQLTMRKIKYIYFTSPHKITFFEGGNVLKAMQKYDEIVVWEYNSL